MVGCNDRDRVAPVGSADRAYRGGMANLARDLVIAAGLAVEDGQERLPDLGLERRAGEGERDIEDLALPSEILG
jgi:hypothetical protein